MFWQLLTSYLSETDRGFLISLTVSQLNRRRESSFPLLGSWFGGIPSVIEFRRNKRFAGTEAQQLSQNVELLQSKNSIAPLKTLWPFGKRLSSLSHSICEIHDIIEFDRGSMLRGSRIGIRAKRKFEVGLLRNITGTSGKNLCWNISFFSLAPGYQKTLCDFSILGLDLLCKNRKFISIFLAWLWKYPKKLMFQHRFLPEFPLYFQ